MHTERSDELLEELRVVEWRERGLERVCCFCCYLLIVRRKVDPVRRLKGQCEQKYRRGTRENCELGNSQKELVGCRGCRREGGSTVQ